MAYLVDEESAISQEKDNKDLDNPKVIQHSGHIAVGDLVTVPDLSVETKNPTDAMSDTFIAAYRKLMTIWTTVGREYIGREARKMMEEQGIGVDDAVDQLVAAKQAFLDKSEEHESTRGILPISIHALLLEQVFASLDSMDENEKPAYLSTLWATYEEFAQFEELKNILWTDNGLMEILDRIRTVVHDHPESETQTDAVHFFHAAEFAYERKFDEAKAALENMQSSPNMKTILLKRLTEAETAAPRVVFDEQQSTANIANLIRLRGEPTITPDQLRAANMRITVGTNFEAVENMLEQPYGRYLSVHEHGTKGGLDPLSSSKTRDSGYRFFRREVEETLGYNPNVFIPRPIYGAVTSDLQIDRASQYGQIALVVKEANFNDQDATFYLGDSFDKSGRPKRVVPQRQINARDATTVYASQLEVAIGRGRDHPGPLPYTEAHVAGLHLKDVEKVVVRCEEGDVQRVAELVNKLAERNVPVEIVLDWRFNSYIKRLMNEGQSEEEAYKLFVGDLHQKFGSREGINFTFIVDGQRPQRARGRANVAFLNYPDITIKQTLVEDLTPEFRSSGEFLE